jgi:hypothetical protein
MLPPTRNTYLDGTGREREMHDAARLEWTPCFLLA